MIDECGLKGERIGGAEVSAVHANFVINMGGATSSEVSQLLARMQEAVYSSFEVRLHPEWKTLGKFSESEQNVWRS